MIDKVQAMNKSAEEMRRRQQELAGAFQNGGMNHLKIGSKSSSEIFRSSSKVLQAVKRNKNFGLTEQASEKILVGLGSVSGKESLNFDLQADKQFPTQQGLASLASPTQFSVSQSSSKRRWPSEGVPAMDFSDARRQILADGIAAYVDKMKMKSRILHRKVQTIEKTIREVKQNILVMENKNQEVKAEMTKINGKMANCEHYRSSRASIQAKVVQMTEKVRESDLTEKVFQIKLDNEARQKERLETILHEVCLQMKENSTNLEIKKLIFEIKSLKSKIRFKA
jgi:hypothetical protein